MLKRQMTQEIYHRGTESTEEIYPRKTELISDLWCLMSDFLRAEEKVEILPRGMRRTHATESRVLNFEF